MERNSTWRNKRRPHGLESNTKHENCRTVSKEATINKTAEKVLCQLKEFGFVFYNKDGAFRAINAKAIDEIRIIPDEKDNDKVTSE